MVPRLIGLLVLAGLLAVPGRAAAQPERHELGQRLRALEAAWEKETDSAARQRATPFLKKAVTTFFAFQPGEAARQLDLARFALGSADGPTAPAAWTASVRLQPERRVLDTTAPSLSFKLLPFYKVDAALPSDARLRLTLRDGQGKPLAPLFDEPIASLPLEGKLTLKDVGAGDHVLHVEIRAGANTLAAGRQGISFVPDLRRRLDELKKAADALPRDPARTDAETLRAHVRLLESLAEGQTAETDYPAARLLTEGEALAKGKDYYKDRPGQFWMTVATGKTNTPVRLLAPDAVKDGKPLPLVVALHGAGGSENLFFDGYGQGAVVQLCARRGWLLVAPRSNGVFGPPVADVIDELARLYPVDRQRVFLVGHSMGAMHAISSASASPERYGAVAALGGSGAPRASDGLKAVRFFVGVGTEDFSLNGARTLKERLDALGVSRVKYMEYRDVEHMMVVPLALPEVLAFFDEAATR